MGYTLQINTFAKKKQQYIKILIQYRLFQSISWFPLLFKIFSLLWFVFALFCIFFWAEKLWRLVNTWERILVSLLLERDFRFFWYSCCLTWSTLKAKWRGFLKKTLWPLFIGWGSTVSRRDSHYERTLTFLTLSPQVCLILIWLTSQWLKAEPTLEPPS